MSKDGGPGPAGGRGTRVAEWAFFRARSGVLSGYRSFGDGPWYPRLASRVIGGQQEDGGWGDTVRTGLSLAALVTGRDPVLVNKLRLDEGQWNSHPDDAAAMVAYVAERREQRLGWQIVDAASSLDDLHEAPLAYLSVETVPTLSDDQRKRLREFTDTGGTILIESSCGDKDVVEWSTRLCNEIWPEWPLTLLPQEHGLWSADQRIGVRHPPLRGVEDGLRACVLVSDRDLSCLWALGDTRANLEAFRLGQNLHAYATDRGALRSKWQTPLPADERYTGQSIKRGKKDRLGVARIQHAGQWSVGRNYKPWDRLTATTLTRIGLTVTEGEPVSPGQAVPEDADLLYLTGRQACDLGEGGAAWLRQALDGGKFLLLEAALGDPRFNEAARAALAAAGLEIRLFAADAPPVTGELFEATGFKLDNIRYSVGLDSLRKAREIASLPDKQAWPEGAAVVLYGIYSGKRLVGVYSPFDVVFSQTGYKAYGNLGYAAEDAQAIAANILLLTSIR
jgi:hypothetical protein